MSLNIKTANGLQKIGGVTRDEVISALGCKPVDEDILKEHIKNYDEFVASTTEGLAEKALNIDLTDHVSDTDNPHQITAGTLGLSNINDDNSGEFIIADEPGNIGFKVVSNEDNTSTTYVQKLEAESITTESITIVNGENTVDVKTKLSSLEHELSSLEQSIGQLGGVTEEGVANLTKTIEDHIIDPTVHFNGAYSSLTGAPNISPDPDAEEASLVITDLKGNIGFEVTDNNGESVVTAHTLVAQNIKIDDGKGKLTDIGSLVELADDKVLLSKELKTYYNVGKITNASGTNPITIGSEGQSLRDVFNNLFNMDEVQPTITSDPSATCTLSGGGDERGTSISEVYYNIEFNEGKYEYEDSTGVTMTSYSFSSGTAAPEKVGSNRGTLTLPSTYIMGESSNFSTDLTVEYSDGHIAKTNLGNDSDPALQIQAGSISLNVKFSTAATDYPYYASSSASTIEAVSATRTSTSLTSYSGKDYSVNKGDYFWIFTRKGSTEEQPAKSIEVYETLIAGWGDFLGGTELMGTVDFTKSNGVSDTFFAYRTKNPSGTSGSVKLRLY